MGATANAGTPIAAIPFASLPASVPLDGTGSTAGAGAIDAYAWQIISQPPPSAATFSSSSSATPTLNSVTLPGTIKIALNVHDTVDGWAWDPDPASGALQGLENTMPSAVIVISAENQYSQIVPVGLGERTTQDLTSVDPGYQNAWGKLLALWNAVDGLQAEVDAIGATPTFDTIYVDNINEKTAAHGIYLNDEAFFWDNAQIATGKALTTNAINAHLASTLTIASGDDLDVSATAALTASGLSVAITAGVANSVVVRGGALYPDLACNVIGEDTAGSGVTVDGVLLKDGDVTTASATDKVKTNLIEAGAVAGGVTTLGISAAGNLSLTTTASGDITATASDDISFTAGDDFGLSVNAGAAAITLDGGLGNATVTASGDAQVAGANAAALTSSAGDVTISAFDDCQLGAGAGTTTIVMDGGAKTIALTADNGINFAGAIKTQSGDLDIEPASGFVSVTGVVLSDTIETAIFPLAVRPGADYTAGAVVGPYDGVLDSCYFVAAVAATSAAGDITVAVYDGGDTELVAPTSIDGVTATNPTISLASFSGGFYVQVSSDNGDAVQGYGLVLGVGYKRQAP